MGDPLDLLPYILLQNIKNSKGGPFGDIENFSKIGRTVPKKNRKGDPSVLSGFVGYVKKVLGLSGFRNVSKKWTDQCEVCRLKKKSHCYSGAYFFKSKTSRLKKLDGKPETFNLFSFSVQCDNLEMRNKFCHTIFPNEVTHF